MTLRTGRDAVSWARGQHIDPYRSWLEDCLMFTRSCFNVGSLYGDAETAYYHTQYRHSHWPPPLGVPVWWTNGGNGHVAISVGSGYVWSNDILRWGKIDKARITTITANWGMHYRGWSEDINGVRVWHPDKADLYPVVDLTDLQAAAQRDPNRSQGGTTDGSVADVKLVEAKLRSLGLLPPSYASDGSFGSATVAAYAKWQKRLGFSGAKADGVPGRYSLEKLGSYPSRPRFDVRY